MTSVYTSREFNQDSAGAKRASQSGPVFISDRGRLAHVLMTIEEYRRLTGSKKTLVDRLAWPEAADVDLPIPDRRTDIGRKIDFD